MRPTRESRPRTILTYGLGGTIVGGGSFSSNSLSNVIAQNSASSNTHFVAVSANAGYWLPHDDEDSEEALDHGSMGATETIDVSTFHWHEGTLNTDCAITVVGFAAGAGLVVPIKIEQDGTGSHAITWDADVVFIGDDQPDQTAASVTWFLLWSDEGDGTIYGARISGDSAVGSLDDLSDVTITAAAENDTLRYNGSAWVDDNRRWEPVTFNFGSGPELVWDGDDLVMEWKAY